MAMRAARRAPARAVSAVSLSTVWATQHYRDTLLWVELWKEVFSMPRAYSQ